MTAPDRLRPMATRQTKRPTTLAREILHRRLYRARPDRLEQLDQTRREMALGMKIRQVREDAGLTQQQLARMIGAQPSAISRIEDADYDGHSVSLLERVAEALDLRLIIDFEHKSTSPRRRLSRLQSPAQVRTPRSACRDAAPPNPPVPPQSFGSGSALRGKTFVADLRGRPERGGLKRKSSPVCSPK